MDFVVPARFCGPPASANGGWVSGHLAARVPADGAVTVRLMSPPPLDRVMSADVHADGVTLTDGTVQVARARPAPPLGTDDVPAPVAFADARAAAALYPGLRDHPFPTCFTCGTARAEGDALRLRTGPVHGGVHAAAWVPTEVTPEIVWAALDCPGAWAVGVGSGRPMVLGEVTAEVAELPRVGSEHVVVAWRVGGEGRKHLSGTALYAGDRLLAQARATWIVVDPAAIWPA